jgi:hypothetical protein
MPVKCRKCGGPHLTMKCGKGKYKSKLNYSNYNNKIFKVKIQNMPLDITNENIEYMLKDWGDINKFYINTFDKYNCSNVLIQFLNKEQAEYFVKTVNNTALNNNNLKVFLVQFNSK